MLQEGLSRQPAFFESVPYQPPPLRQTPASVWEVLNPHRAGFKPPTFAEWLAGEEHAAAVADARAAVTVTLEIPAVIDVAAVGTMPAVHAPVRDVSRRARVLRPVVRKAKPRATSFDQPSKPSVFELVLGGYRAPAGKDDLLPTEMIDQPLFLDPSVPASTDAPHAAAASIPDLLPLLFGTPTGRTEAGGKPVRAGIRFSSTQGDAPTFPDSSQALPPLFGAAGAGSEPAADFPIATEPAATGEVVPMILQLPEDGSERRLTQVIRSWFDRQH